MSRCINYNVSQSICEPQWEEKRGHDEEPHKRSTNHMEEFKLEHYMKRDTPLCHDEDLDMQLEDISPEHGGSSLQLSTIKHGNFLPFFGVAPYVIIQY